MKYRFLWVSIQINYPSDPTHKLKSGTYTSIFPWDDKKFVLGRTYEVLLKNTQIHFATLMMARRYTLETIPDFCAWLSEGKDTQHSLPLLRRQYPDLKQDSTVGIYLFTQLEEFPGSAGEQPGAATDSSPGVEGPAMLLLGGNPLPIHLTRRDDPKSIEELSVYVASAFQHALLIEARGVQAGCGGSFVSVSNRQAPEYPPAGGYSLFF